MLLRNTCSRHFHPSSRPSRSLTCLRNKYSNPAKNTHLLSLQIRHYEIVPEEGQVIHKESAKESEPQRDGSRKKSPEWKSKAKKYDLQTLEMTSEYLTMNSGGLGALERFYTEHVQYWPKALKNDGFSDPVVQRQTFAFLTRFNNVALYLTEDDTMSFMVEPLRDTYLLDNSSVLSYIWEAHFKRIWENARKREVFIRADQQAPLSDVSSLKHMRLPARIRQLKEMTVDALSKVRNAKIEACPLEIQGLILLLQASSISPHHTYQAISTWESTMTREIPQQDEKTRRDMQNIFLHFLVAVFQWGKQQGQQEVVEASIIQLIHKSPFNSAATMRILRTMKIDRRETDKSSVHGQWNPSEALEAFRAGIETDTFKSMLKKPNLYFFHRIFPDLVHILATKMDMSREKLLGLHHEYLGKVKEEKGDITQISKVLASVLQHVDLCTTDNLELHYEELTVEQRTAHLLRCMHITFLRGDHESVLSMFERYCTRVTDKFFVRPNMDIVYVVSLIHLAVLRNHPRVISFLESLTHVDLGTSHFEDVHATFSDILHRKDIKGELSQLPEAVQLHHERLKSMHEEHFRDLAAELRMDAEVPLYDLDAMYEVLNHEEM